MFDPAWEAAHAERAWGRWPSEHLVRFVARHYPHSAAFVELGCGAGAQTIFLVSEGHNVYAIDGSQSAVAEAAWRYGGSVFRTPGIATFARQDVVTFDMDAGLVDCVVDVACLQHLEAADAAAVVDRALGWLKPGGRFFSLHASLDADEAIVSRRDTVRVRRAREEQIRDLFDGYRIDLGHELIFRPQGGRVAHWIIEAQKPE